MSYLFLYSMLWHRKKCAKNYVLRSSFITRKPEAIFQFTEYTIIGRMPNHNYYKIYLLCVYLSISLWFNQQLWVSQKIWRPRTRR